MRSLLPILAIIVCSMSSLAAPAGRPPSPRLRCVSGELIVKFRTAQPSGLSALHRKHHLRQMARVFPDAPAPAGAKARALADGFQRTFKLRFDPATDIEAVAQDYRANPSVEYAEPNYISHLCYVPADPLYVQQWAHQNTHAETAWDTQRGSPEVVIAVVDTGVNYTHEDLAANIWRDPQNNPGKDFVDINTAEYTAAGYTLIAGEDYTGVDLDPSDYNGHGTHCAGIIGAAADDGKGVVGVCHSCKIMPVRAGFSITDPLYGEVGSLEDDDIANAIRYAADNGAEVISMSFGGSSSQVEADAIAYASSLGVILVAAAGNEDSDGKSYPAACDGVIAVAATAQDDTRAYYSNYGYWVDLAAPGGDYYKDTQILSTVPKQGGAICHPSGYRNLQGTSMAAPYVAGAAGLLKSQHPGFTADRITALLYAGVDELTPAAIYIGRGRVNLAKSLALAQAPTAELDDLENTYLLGQGTLTLTGSAYGTGFQEYHLYYRNTTPTAGDWIPFHTGTEQVHSSTLGTLDLSLLDQGFHEVALVVEDTSGANCADRIGFLNDLTLFWQTTAVAGNLDDLPESVIQTSDGGYLVAGWSWVGDVTGAGHDAWLAKLDAQGHKLWGKSYGTEAAGDYFHTVQEAPDGGYLAVGHTYSYGNGLCDLWLVKTDASGNLLWQKTYGLTSYDTGRSMVRVADGYIIAGGLSLGAAGYNVWLLKIDFDGNKLWERNFGGADEDIGNAVTPTRDGGYIIAASTRSYGAGEAEIWLIKTDSDGHKLWDKTFGSPQDDGASAVIETRDGDYVLAGYTSPAWRTNGWLIKTDSQGNKLWDKTFGGDQSDAFASVQETWEGGYLLTGYTQSHPNSSRTDSDIWVVKTDRNGNQEWSRTYGGGGIDDGWCIILTRDFNYLLIGYTSLFSPDGFFDAWVLKLRSGLVPAQQTFPAGWNMISLPLSPFVTDPAEVFRDTARLPIPISDRLWRYDRANLRYLEYWDLFPSQFGLCQRGEGYWLYLDQPATVLYPGLAPGSFEVSLPTHGWYLIGGASADTQVADLRVRDGQGAVHTWPEAIGALVSDPLYGWSSAGLCYETVGSDVLDDLHALQAWQGYWLYTFQDNLTLILP